MTRTICVKGTGSISAKADLVVLNFEISTLNKSYSRAFDNASSKTAKLSRCIESLGFDKSDLKTIKFDIDTRYENVHYEDGSYEREFSGYLCRYKLKLSFDFNNERLKEVFGAVASCGADAEIRIEFTVKDDNQMSKELLVSAAENARAKAEILCRASGVKLGELLKIDYSWGEIVVSSDSDIDYGDVCLGMSRVPDFTPDDIDFEDTAAFVWEIK